MRHDLAAVRQTSSVPDSAGATVVTDAGRRVRRTDGAQPVRRIDDPRVAVAGEVRDGGRARGISPGSLGAIGRTPRLARRPRCRIACRDCRRRLPVQRGRHDAGSRSGTETPAATSSPAPVPPGPAGSGEAANTSASATPFPAFERGCKSGDAHSCTEVGMGFRNGRGSARDDARALDYFERGCTGGDLVGCLNVGEFYANGMGGVTRDYARAAALYQRACNGSVMPGCVFLAQFYAGGRGVERDDKRARPVSQGMQREQLGRLRRCRRLAGDAPRATARRTARGVTLQEGLRRQLPAGLPRPRPPLSRCPRSGEGSSRGVAALHESLRRRRRQRLPPQGRRLSGHSHAAPRTPDASPCFARTSRVATWSEKIQRPHAVGTFV